MAPGLVIDQYLASRGIEGLQRAFEHSVDPVAYGEQRARIDGALPQQKAVERVSRDKDDFARYASRRRLFENAEIPAIGRRVTVYSPVAFAGDFGTRRPLKMSEGPRRVLIDSIAVQEV